MKALRLAIAVLCFWPTVHVAASGEKDPSPALPPATPPVGTPAWTEAPPDIDGDVLGDPVWARAQPLTAFWQTTPDEGSPATQETEVRILLDRRAIYVGVVCFDREPDKIIVADSRRDSSLENTDSFQMILDTYLDRRNGFVFGTNPAGIEYDAQVTNEGQGGESGRRQSSGAGGGFNINWDGSWTVRAAQGDYGWSAEFEIPLRTLRFRPEESASWGANFQRNIRRNNERAFWAPLPRQFNLYRLSMAGTLSDIRLPSQKNWQVTPYVLGEMRRRDEPVRTNWLGDAGLDTKVNFTPSLTLDGTLNTDFAQVEVDEQQINLDRFNLFYPEKRPFFLENAGFFTAGAPGEVELFFSRRIGLGPEGEVVPIAAGGRLSGKIGEYTNIGILNMQTRSATEVAPANNFSVVRLSREFQRRSSLGGIFVNRQSTGEFGSSRDYNRTYGFDGKWGIGEFAEVSGFLAGTSTPGTEQGQYAYKVGSRYDSQAWLLSLNYTEVGEGFNPEVGFLMRESFRKVDWMVYHRWRPENLWGLHEMRPHVSYRGYWNLEGFQETGYLHVDNHWEWQGGAEIHTGINFTREGVLEPFEIYPGLDVAPGTYDHQEAQLVALTNQGAWISARFETNFGGFFGGSRVRTEPTLRMRLGEKFNTEAGWSRNDIDLTGGRFQTNLARARVSYSLTPRIFVQSLIQYNDLSEIWSANLRFAWLQSANTGLFIVYNDTRGFESYGIPPDRSLIVKYSKLFNILD